MRQLMSEATSQRRFQTVALSVFAAVAVFLALVGLYGLMAYAVKQRTAEIGIRIALGASGVAGARDGGVERASRWFRSAWRSDSREPLAITRLGATWLYGVSPPIPLRSCWSRF